MKTIYIHPENYNNIKKQFPEITMVSNIYGIRLYIDINILKYAKKWQFPKDRFVEYDKSDEKWAKSIKFGKEVDDETKPIVLEIDDSLLPNSYNSFNWYY